jgi:glycosyltransferase involved in cell wall biosynthesis
MWGRQKPGDYYSKAKILIMTSAFEGFPNVLIESQSYATVPVVFNSYAALSWITNEKKDTLFSKPFDVDEMAQHIISLATNPKQLEQMSEKSLENAERFVIDNVGQIWLDFFATLNTNYST